MQGNHTRYQLRYFIRSLNMNWVLFILLLFVFIFFSFKTALSGKMTVEQIQKKTQATYLAIGGEEYLKYLVKQGQAPAGIAKQLGAGVFEIQTNSAGSYVITGKVDGLQIKRHYSE